MMDGDRIKASIIASKRHKGRGQTDGIAMPRLPLSPLGINNGYRAHRGWGCDTKENVKLIVIWCGRKYEIMRYDTKENVKS